MSKYDEARARMILESAADVLSPDLEARREAARELIKELGHLAGSTRIRTVTAGDSRARLSIGEHVVTINFTGMAWEVHPEGSTAMTVDLKFDAHEKKFVGDTGNDKDGLVVLLEAATESLKDRRQAQAVQKSLGGALIRH